MGDNSLVKVAIAAAVAGGLACAITAPASAQSLTDRFKSLFGGKSEEPAAPPPRLVTRSRPRPRTPIPTFVMKPPPRSRN